MSRSTEPLRRAAPFISLNNVTIRLFDRLLFKRTTWTMRADEHWAVVGPNGSGKSTLVKALCGEARVVGGEIVHHFAEDEGADDGLGIAPEQQIVHVSFEDQRDLVLSESSYHQSRWNSEEGEGVPTVSEFLSLESIEGVVPFEIRRPKPTDASFPRRRAEAVRLLGIGGLLRRKLTHLSNGEMRKTLTARALMQSPRLLILDDPFSGLDNRSRAAFRKVVNRLMTGRMRVLLITPRIEEIPSGITHVLYVEAGKALAQGDRESVLKGRCVRRFFAARPGAVRAPVGRGGGRRARSAGAVLVRVRDASVSYGRVRVLRHVDWTIRDGENWALLGPNGAGKSTLLSLILGDNPQAYANEIELFGRGRGTGESIWDIKRKIGWVAPEIQIHYDDDVTAYRVVCSGFFDTIGLYRRCSAEQRRRAREWMRILSLSDLAGEAFGDLSAGQQRMVLLARALVKDPCLLILDEPCQGLDPEHRATALRLIGRVGRQTATNLIYVTHHADEMPSCVTHVLQLDRGAVVRRGRRRTARRRGNA